MEDPQNRHSSNTGTNDLFVFPRRGAFASFKTPNGVQLLVSLVSLFMPYRSNSFILYKDGRKDGLYAHHRSASFN